MSSGALLRKSGVLTHAHLVEVCGAAHWSDHGFKRALNKAVSVGLVRRIGDDLYEGHRACISAETA